MFPVSTPLPSLVCIFRFSSPPLWNPWSPSGTPIVAKRNIKGPICAFRSQRKTLRQCSEGFFSLARRLSRRPTCGFGKLIAAEIQEMMHIIILQLWVCQSSVKHMTCFSQNFANTTITVGSSALLQTIMYSTFTKLANYHHKHGLNGKRVDRVLHSQQICMFCRQNKS